MKNQKKRYDTTVNVLAAVLLLCIALIVVPSGAQAADHTPFPGAVLDLADQISDRVEAVADQAAEEALGITPASPMMETLTQGVSELEAQMDRRLTRIGHRAVAAVRRIDNPFYTRTAHYLQKPARGRLEGVRDND